MKFQVDGRSLNVTSLNKVLYPSTGTTKADVMHYYLSVAEVMIPQVTRRPVTRKRWPDGVEGESFFRKDLEDSAPEWVTVGEIEHSTSVNRYPLVDAPSTLAWFAQVAALELHTPQWRFAPDGSHANPDRMVLDLDPGPGVTMAQTAQVALWCREILEKSPFALRLMKASFNAGEDGMAGLQQLAHDTNLLFYGNEEAREGREAYKEKRRPEFERFPRRP